jgi:hypothetical protein
MMTAVVRKKDLIIAMGMRLGRETAHPRLSLGAPSQWVSPLLLYCKVEANPAASLIINSNSAPTT